MDRDVDALTVLLMDPFLTRDEAEREAAAGGWGREETGRRPRTQGWRPGLRSAAPHGAQDNQRF